MNENVLVLPFFIRGYIIKAAGQTKSLQIERESVYIVLPASPLHSLHLPLSYNTLASAFVRLDWD